MKTFVTYTLALLLCSLTAFAQKGRLTTKFSYTEWITVEPPRTALNQTAIDDRQAFKEGIKTFLALTQSNKYTSYAMLVTDSYLLTLRNQYRDDTTHTLDSAQGVTIEGIPTVFHDSYNPLNDDNVTSTLLIARQDKGYFKTTIFVWAITPTTLTQKGQQIPWGRFLPIKVSQGMADHEIKQTVKTIQELAGVIRHYQTPDTTLVDDQAYLIPVSSGLKKSLWKKYRKNWLAWRISAQDPDEWELRQKARKAAYQLQVKQAAAIAAQQAQAAKKDGKEYVPTPIPPFVEEEMEYLSLSLGSSNAPQPILVLWIKHKNGRKTCFALE